MNAVDALIKHFPDTRYIMICGDCFGDAFSYHSMKDYNTEIGYLIPDFGFNAFIEITRVWGEENLEKAHKICPNIPYEMPVVRVDRDRITCKIINEIRFSIEGENIDECLATFFREYENKYKYCNDVQFYLPIGSDKKDYSNWISDIKNYAKNGGDLW